MPPHPPRLREPILNLPAIISLCLVVLIGIHAVRMLLPEETDFSLIIDWSVIPVRWSVAFGGIQVDEVMRALREGVPDETVTPLMALAQYVLIGGVFTAVYLGLEWLTRVHELEALGITLWNPVKALRYE